MDFSQLTDEQLIELIQAALAETIKRGQSVVDAAREVMLDEKREAEIKAKAAARAKERIAAAEAERIAREEEDRIRQNQARMEEQKKIDEQKRLWSKKKEQAEKMLVVCEDRDVWINVWKSGSEKRVYINDGEPFAKGTIELACMYVTGNAKQAPGSMTANSKFWASLDGELKQQFKDTVKEIGNFWNSTKFSARQAADYNG